MSFATGVAGAADHLAVRSRCCHMLHRFCGAPTAVAPTDLPPRCCAVCAVQPVCGAANWRGQRHSGVGAQHHWPAPLHCEWLLGVWGGVDMWVRLPAQSHPTSAQLQIVPDRHVHRLSPAGWALQPLCMPHAAHLPNARSPGSIGTHLQTDMYTASGQWDARSNRVIQKIYEAAPPVSAPCDPMQHVPLARGPPTHAQAHLPAPCCSSCWQLNRPPQPFACRTSGGQRCWTRCCGCSRRHCCTAGEAAVVLSTKDGMGLGCAT